MKGYLFILTLLVGISFFVTEEVQSDGGILDLQTQEVVLVKKGISSVQHSLEILGRDLEDNKCLAPRRTIQNVSNTLNIQLQKIVKRVILHFHLRGINLLRKISEEAITCQTINISALLCCKGYHVYGLRKIII